MLEKPWLQYSGSAVINLNLKSAQQSRWEHKPQRKGKKSWPETEGKNKIICRVLSIVFGFCFFFLLRLPLWYKLLFLLKAIYQCCIFTYFAGMSHRLHEERCGTSCSFLTDSQQRKQKTLVNTWAKTHYQECISLEKASWQEQFRETPWIFTKDFNSEARKEHAETLWVAYCIIYCI